ncbi:hypothetical protein EXU85_20365 [Spirosoma sp. KCTC 42546]|uniref:hypothetical protein n=1 Tax=Spirosoma sp. KCTC 42546 TaxID=2520506 RepID=UPI001157A489|nr:hypothetical protein [Spirosoma sp. KCTC 42546]QDK80834.1 hypothetical protein EXU85_20365 [Spirosoma sp. KCTC 42546]
MVVKQYPYQLWVRPVGANAVPNQDGDFTGSASAVFEMISACRDEMNGKGQSITLEDQTTHVYDFLVQLPLSCPDIKPGCSIKVISSGSMVRVFGTAKQFVRGQLHCQLFV